MRIVAGTAKGRTISVPKGLEVRPTTDRVREALFSSITPRVAGATVLDLFAGSGALGLEALSRGAASVVFVERSRRTASILRRNIAQCGFDPSAVVIERDALAALKQLQRSGATFDLIFLDPPYKGPLLSRALRDIDQLALARPAGLVVAEHLADGPPDVPAGLVIASKKRYGKTILSFVQHVLARS